MYKSKSDVFNKRLKNYMASDKLNRYKEEKEWRKGRKRKQNENSSDDRK